MEGTGFIELVISDPWEWQTELGPGPLAGQIVGRSGNYALVQLAAPVTFHERRVEFLVASPRHSGRGWDELIRGDTVPPNFALANSARDWQLSGTRHGADLAGAMRKADVPSVTTQSGG